MLLKLNRIHLGTHMHGCLEIFNPNKVFQCWTLEHPTRPEKLKGITGINDGIYEIVTREEDSPLREKWAKYHWFKWFLMLKDVPNFRYIYIHSGNFLGHTDGCILPGEYPGKQSVMNSVPCMAEIYENVYFELERDRKVFIDIKTIN